MKDNTIGRTGALRAMAAAMVLVALATSAYAQGGYRRGGRYGNGNGQVYGQPGAIPAQTPTAPTTAPVNPRASAHVTLDAVANGPMWVGSTNVPITVTVTNLTVGKLVLANFNDPKYGNLYFDMSVTDSAGTVSPPDFPVRAATPVGGALVSLDDLSSYSFMLSGMVGMQYVLTPGTYTVNLHFHITSPAYTADASAPLIVRDVHDSLVGNIIDFKAQKTPADEGGLIANDVTGHVALVKTYKDAVWAVFWRDELVPVVDKYADDRRMGYTDIPPAPKPYRSAMRYLQWLGPADKDTVPTIDVAPDNTIKVSFGAPTKRVTTVTLAKFLGPVTMVADGNAPLKTDLPPASAAPVVVGPHHVTPATGPAGSIVGDENGVISVGE